MKISETFLLDAAFQYYVITHAGVTLDDFFLVFINPEYVLENELDLKKLFVKQSVLEEVKTRQQYIEKQIKTGFCKCRETKSSIFGLSFTALFSLAESSCIFCLEFKPAVVKFSGSSFPE